MLSSVPYFLPSKEEAKEIKAGNKGLIDRFYLQNLPQIQACAKAFCRRNRGFARYSVEDYVQEAYLHFSEFSFENIKYFTHTLYFCFNRYNMGGKRKVDQKTRSRYFVGEEECILDAELPSGEGVYGDIIPSKECVMLAPSFSISDKLYTFLLPFLNTKWQKELFAYFYWTGFSHTELAELLGKSLSSIHMMHFKIFKNLRKHEDEIRKFLDEIGYADRNGIPA